jgi:hypothetical protein
METHPQVSEVFDARSIRIYANRVNIEENREQVVLLLVNSYLDIPNSSFSRLNSNRLLGSTFSFKSALQ